MEEQLVNFETANLAKEKGFNERTKHYYMNGGVESKSMKGLENWNNWFDDEKLKYYSRPTQSLLQKWLREVHKLNIWVTEWEMSLWYFNIKDGRVSPTRTIRILAKNIKDFEFSTYEEALEKALEEALKMIKE